MSEDPKQLAFKYDLLKLMVANQDWLSSDSTKMQVRYFTMLDEFINKWSPTTNNEEDHE